MHTMPHIVSFTHFKTKDTSFLFFTIVHGNHAWYNDSWHNDTTKTVICSAEIEADLSFVLKSNKKATSSKETFHTLVICQFGRTFKNQAFHEYLDHWLPL
eukprot:115883_1